MTVDREILRRTGMSPEQIKTYLRAEERLLPGIEPLARKYFVGGYGYIAEAYEPLRTLCATEAELCGAELVFVMRCIELRAQTLSGRERELFLESIIDISCKVNECQAYKKAFGIFVFNWYDGLIKNRRLTLGRLQFEPGSYYGPDITAGDFTLRDGDKKLQCHIPSGLGPLTQQACLASYRRAWEEFPEFRKNGVLPILCHSWLFYPDYDRVFPENSNVGQFRKSFTMYTVGHQERFDDVWRVFYMDMPEDPKALPRDTSMRRAFADYIENGGTFGDAAGILLFDGQRIVR